MAYSSPYTFTALELLTAAKMNAIQTNITALWPYTTAGDIPYASNATSLARLGIGSIGDQMLSSGAAPLWADGSRYIAVQLNADVALTTGDNKGVFFIPPALDSWNITHVSATRMSGTGVPAFQLRNVTDSVDVLTTKVTIDSGETWSGTAAAAPVIDTTKDDVASGDRFAWDVDVAGTSSMYDILLVGLKKT